MTEENETPKSTTAKNLDGGKGVQVGWEPLPNPGAEKPKVVRPGEGPLIGFDPLPTPANQPKSTVSSSVDLTTGKPGPAVTWENPIPPTAEPTLARNLTTGKMEPGPVTSWSGASDIQPPTQPSSEEPNSINK